MTHKHYTMPLKSHVRVRGRLAEIAKHDSTSPHKCIVHWLEGEPDQHGSMSAWVTIKSVRPLQKLRVRPWYRVMNDKARQRAKGLK